MLWGAFERTFGPLTVQERVDYAAVVNAYVTAKVGGVKGNPRLERLFDWGRLSRPQADGFEALWRMGQENQEKSRA